MHTCSYIQMIHTYRSYIHTYIHACIQITHTYVHKHLHRYRHTYKSTVAHRRWSHLHPIPWLRSDSRTSEPFIGSHGCHGACKDCAQHPEPSNEIHAHYSQEPHSAAQSMQLHHPCSYIGLWLQQSTLAATRFGRVQQCEHGYGCTWSGCGVCPAWKALHEWNNVRATSSLFLCHRPCNIYAQNMQMCSSK